MEKQILEYIKLFGKKQGWEIAINFNISQSDFRYFITKIRRNWEDKESFLVSDNEGYWVSKSKFEIEKYFEKVKNRFNGLKKEYEILKSLKKELKDCEHFEDEQLYEEKELEKAFWNGELTEWQPLDDMEFVPDDYGYEWCENCKKYYQD